MTKREKTQSSKKGDLVLLDQPHLVNPTQKNLPPKLRSSTYGPYIIVDLMNNTARLKDEGGAIVKGRFNVKNLSRYHNELGVKDTERLENIITFDCKTKRVVQEGVGWDGIQDIPEKEDEVLNPRHVTQKALVESEPEVEKAVVDLTDESDLESDKETSLEDEDNSEPEKVVNQENTMRRRSRRIRGLVPEIGHLRKNRTGDPQKRRLSTTEKEAKNFIKWKSKKKET